MRTLRAFTLLALALTSVTSCSDDDTAGSRPGTETATQDDADHCDSVPSIEPGQYEQTHTHDGIEQMYGVVVPESYDPGTATDLYIVVPGGSGSAQAALMGWAPSLVGLDALVVFPSVAQRGHADGTDDPCNDRRHRRPVLRRHFPRLRDGKLRNRWVDCAADGRRFGCDRCVRPGNRIIQHHRA